MSSAPLPSRGVIYCSPHLQPHPAPSTTSCTSFFGGGDGTAVGGQPEPFHPCKHELVGCRGSSSLSSTHKPLPAASSYFEEPWAGSSRPSFSLSFAVKRWPRHCRVGDLCHKPRASAIHWPWGGGSPLSWHPDYVAFHFQRGLRIYGPFLIIPVNPLPPPPPLFPYDDWFCISKSCPAPLGHVSSGSSSAEGSLPSRAWLQGARRAGTDPACQLGFLDAHGFIAVGFLGLRHHRSPHFNFGFAQLSSAPQQTAQTSPPCAHSRSSPAAVSEGCSVAWGRWQQ